MRKIQRQEEMRKVREEIERQQEEDYRNKEADQGWYFWFPIQNPRAFFPDCNVPERNVIVKS